MIRKTLALILVLCFTLVSSAFAELKGEDWRLPQTIKSVKDLDPVDFEQLLKHGVKGISARRINAGLELYMDLEDEVCWGGFPDCGDEVHIDAHVSGVLVNQYVDLDDDGQDELLVLYSVSSGRNGYMRLGIYEEYEQGYRLMADFDTGCCWRRFEDEGFTQHLLSILKHEGSTYIVDGDYYPGNEDVQSAIVTIYRYDGQQLLVSAYAMEKNVCCSYLIKGPISIDTYNGIWDDMEVLPSSDTEVKSVLAKYKIDPEQALSIYAKPVFGEWRFGYYDYQGFEVIGNCLKDYGVEQEFVLAEGSGKEYEYRRFDKFRISAGTPIFSDELLSVKAEGKFKAGRSVQLIFHTELQHFGGKDLPKGGMRGRIYNVILPERGDASNPLYSERSFGNAHTTGDVNIRRGPNLKEGTLGSIAKGEKLKYDASTIEVDERGVAWYYVFYNGNEGWCSSKYVEVID